MNNVLVLRFLAFLGENPGDTREAIPLRYALPNAWVSVFGEVPGPAEEVASIAGEDLQDRCTRLERLVVEATGQELEILEPGRYRTKGTGAVWHSVCAFSRALRPGAVTQSPP